MFTDAEIQYAAERYVQNSMSEPEMVESVPPTDRDEQHANEILGWRMAAEDHLNTIDRLREEIKDLQKRNILLEQAQRHGQQIEKPLKLAISASTQLSDAIKAKAASQRARLFPEKV